MAFGAKLAGQSRAHFAVACDDNIHNATSQRIILKTYQTLYQELKKMTIAYQ